MIVPEASIAVGFGGISASNVLSRWNSAYSNLASIPRHRLCIISPLIGMYPAIRRDLARLGQLDHVNWRRGAALLARAALQRGLKLPDRRAPQYRQHSTAY